MARLAREVIPGVPHHVTQRGNRRQTTFFEQVDYERYLRLAAEFTREFAIEVLAWCLMPNHVHIVLTPPSAEALRRAIGEWHRRYTRGINDRFDWTGHLWQGRFYSVPMDEAHLVEAVRYVELNPVRAGLVTDPFDYPWSSAQAHLQGRDDILATVRPMLERVGDWRSFLGALPQDGVEDALRRHTRTGRPLGSDAFVERCEREAGRPLRASVGGRPVGSRDSTPRTRRSASAITRMLSPGFSATSLLRSPGARGFPARGAA
jgi:putative transposase